MKERIYSLLSDALPAVDLQSDFLFSELDSLSVTTILFLLAAEYDIPLNAQDVTPKNFMSLDSLVRMVESKLENK
jgi:acyl carrier protein